MLAYLSWTTLLMRSKTWTPISQAYELPLVVF